MGERKGATVILLAVAALGIGMGATGAIASQRLWSSGCTTESVAAAAPKKSCCNRTHATSEVAKCPVHPGDNGPVVDDRVAAKQLQHELVDGVFRRWVELGRAPTPDEVAKRLNVTFARPIRRSIGWRRAARQ
jgi:hypothetical protein